MIEVFGAAAEQWLMALPQILEDCEQRWNLRLHAPFALSYGYVAPATRADGTQVVIKARVPDSETRWEIDALRAYAGEAAVRLLDFDAAAGVMLLERIAPGTMLKDVEDDDEATVIGAGIIVSLLRPPPDGSTFPTLQMQAKALADLRGRYDGGTGPLPQVLVARAESTFSDDASSEAALLHGDVHHENILLDRERGWLAIDPHGVIGEPAYETGTFLSNHLMHRHDPARVLERRVGVLSEQLAMDRERIIEWALAFCVLSACWSHESHGDGWQRAIAVAEILAELQSTR